MTPTDERFDLFVSYAHTDDRDGWITQFVNVLIEARNRVDYRPWQRFFDVDGIRPGHDWEQRLAKAGSAGALLVMLSPAYFRSEWCRKEWAAFREQEQNTDQDERIFYVYLETDEAFEKPFPGGDHSPPESLWRADLQRRQYTDLRPWFARRKWWHRLWARLGLAPRQLRIWQADGLQQALARLERAIHDRLRDYAQARQAPRPGVPYQSLPRPDYFVPRPRELEALKKVVLGTEGGAGVVVSAVHGLGGVGKSTLAAALVDDPDVRRHFKDGILWATLGQQPEVPRLLTEWVRALGDHEFKGPDIASAREHLRGLLSERRMLLVVDDAWSTEAAKHFRVGGPQCRVLVTTREAALARDLGARLIPLDVLSPEQALLLLKGRLGRPLAADEGPVAADLIEAVGRLPLAVELTAAQAADGVRLQELRAELRREEARLGALELPGADEAETESIRKRRSLRASVNLSLARLSHERRQRLAWLGATPDDAVLNPRMVATIWQVEENKARDELRILRDKALLLNAPEARIDGQGLIAFHLHDVLHAAARNLVMAPAAAAEGALPGLGLTLPDAHRELLRRYREQRTRGGQWHTLPEDGYIHGRLGWHLVQAGDVGGLHALLREETAAGCNGWHEANERRGQPAVFVEDVRLAWKHADEAVLAGKGGLAEQCRLALVTASLNSLAGNVPTELLETLVETGVWTVEQGLTCARQIPDRGQRGSAFLAVLPHVPQHARAPVLVEAFQALTLETLEELAPHLPAELLSEALQMARSTSDEKIRCSALAALTPHLPEEPRRQALSEALQAARSIQDQENRGHALARLAPRLPKELLSEALQTALAISVPGYRCVALGALAPRLPEEQRQQILSEALKDARSTADHSDRSRALGALAPALTEELRQQVLSEALAAARCIPDDGGAFAGEGFYRESDYRSYALRRLARQLPEEQRQQVFSEALQAAAAIPDEFGRGFALQCLVAQLPTMELKSQALQVARSIQDEERRDGIVAELAPWLPEESEALQAARSIGHAGHRARALGVLARYLEEEELRRQVLSEALHAARSIADEETRPDILRHLAPLLPEELRRQVLSEALQAARDVPDKGWRNLGLRGKDHHSGGRRFGALEALAPELPEELRRQALSEAFRAACSISDEDRRKWALKGLAPQLPEELLPEALQAARAFEKGEDRCHVLVAMAPRLSGELLAEDFQAARSIGDERIRRITLKDLAPHFPKELRRQALAEALQGADESWLAVDLERLAVGLPAEVLSEALKTARAIRNEGWRCHALGKLAPHLAEELLAEALQAARTIEQTGPRSRALGALAPRLPEELRREVLSEALQDARSCPDGRERARALEELAPRLLEKSRGQVLSEALQAARSLADGDDRCLALRKLAPHLPEELRRQVLSEALHAASFMGGWNCWQALEAPQLSAELLSEVLRIGCLLQGGGLAREHALRVLAPHLPEELRRQALSEALQAARSIENENYRYLHLDELAPLLPPELMPDALQAALSIQDDDFRSYVLSALAPRLSAELLPTALQATTDRRTQRALALRQATIAPSDGLALWTDMLHISASQPRPDLLADLRDLLPLIQALAGPNAAVELVAITHAIRDVCRWWP
jgi:hypothetical protein